MGLDPEGYGNPDFCWLSVHDSLVWSLAGPGACALAVRTSWAGEVSRCHPWVPASAPPAHPALSPPQLGLLFLVLAARATCATPQGFEKKGTA